MNANHHEITGPTRTQQITLRGPAELADALPFMLGFHPTDSVVLAALHGEHGRFGGRVRLGIPRSPHEWEATADHLADTLVEGCGRRGERPDGIVVFLCQNPAPGETARRVMERLRPFAQRLRTACGALDIPVYEALCISDGLYFSYCCPDSRCCPPDGTPLALSGTSVMAAAATYAGIQVRGSLRDMQARLRPGGSAGQERQRAALDAAAASIVPRILDGAEEEGRKEVRETTLRLARDLLGKFTQPAGGSEKPGGVAGTAEADAIDDALVGTAEAAALIIGLQDRTTRDQVAEWMEGAEGRAALRLWRVLARRCVAPYQEHAAAPLTLAGWTAWSTGDEPAARVALGLALEADPEYVFARLLHQACNEGLDPESLRACLRSERDARLAGDRPAPVSERTAEQDLRTETPAAPAVPGAGRTATTRRTSGKPGRRTTAPAKAAPPAGVRPGGKARTGPAGRAPRPDGRRGSRSGG
ncbi:MULTISPECIES: DUF4192 domain-containing protein [unclassified Streptomyces]|uniref:DUF4192 domain-containing protein n=1 Tax=unclassified Streptomyces TaxID=2593676 RepID=UPI00369FC84A